jgi:hypothetical protein
VTVDTITMAHVDEALANAHFIEVKQALRALRLYVLPQRTAAAGDADGCRGARGARGGVAGSLSTESGAAGVGTDGGGEGADVVLRRVAREVRRLSTALVHVLQYLPLSALGAVPGDTAGLEREGESAVCGGGAGEGEQDSLRRLLGKGVRLMLREHKEPKIEALLGASLQGSQGGRPNISVDR